MYCVGQIITCPYKRETEGQREKKRSGECYAAGFEGGGRGFKLGL